MWLFHHTLDRGPNVQILLVTILIMISRLLNKGYQKLRLTLMSLTVNKPKNEEELKAQSFQAKCLGFESSHWKKEFNDYSKMLVDLQNNAASRASFLITNKNITSNKVRDHTWIPVLNVKRSVLFDNSSSTEGVATKTLSIFIRKFERAYSQHQVSVEDHWFFHLESCMEKNDADYVWFNQNIKLAYLKNKDECTWEYAQNQLRSRFDSENNCGIVAHNLKLYNLRQKDSESLSAFLDKVLMLAEKSGVDTTKCFLSMVYTVEFQEKVRSALVEYMKSQHSSDRSIHAISNEDDFFHYYSDFFGVVKACSFHSKYLEEALLHIQRKNKQACIDKSTRCK
jgi:hypothetical protein